MKKNQYSDVTFELKEYEGGKPWLLAAFDDPGLSCIGDDMLGLQFRDGVTFAQAKETQIAPPQDGQGNKLHQALNRVPVGIQAEVFGAANHPPVTVRPTPSQGFALFNATAARIRVFRAFSFTLSPSRKSMARLTPPSRLELKRPAGSSKKAPWANVNFTALL
jgi:hypothetical protein